MRGHLVEEAGRFKGVDAGGWVTVRSIAECGFRPKAATTLLDYVPVMILAGTHYRVACTLYSKDGKHAAEVREFSNGETYLLESE